MPRKKTSLVDLLFQAPWWLSVLVAAVVYAFLGHILPNLETSNQLIGVLRTAFSSLAPYFSFMILLIAPFSYLNRRRKVKQLDKQRSIDSVRDLDWRNFEELVAEAYRRKGYRVTEGGYGADGGIDLELRKGKEVTIVQCKQWKTQKIGVSVVREMFGVLSANSATHCIIIGSGKFTQQAIDFASDKPVELIDGQGLLSIINNVQTTPQVEISSPKSCPLCGNELVARTARRGQHAGNTFLGCAGFPTCRYTE